MNIRIDDTDEFAFTESDFRTIAEIAHRESGINLPEAKTQLVYSRLLGRVRKLQLSSFREYCDLIEQDTADEERQRLISALTTNVTRFGRESHHFEHLRQKVLPKLVERAVRGDRIRLWSAACATGEEAYEIAFEVLDQCPNARELDIKILATDIDPNALACAQTGSYLAADVRSLSAARVERYFVPADAASHPTTVANAPRALISFRPLNLVRPWPVRGPFDAVFCRNVAIYFDAPTQRALWDRFSAVVAASGTLFIGHSERITGAAASCFSQVGITTYERRPPVRRALAPNPEIHKGLI